VRRASPAGYIWFYANTAAGILRDGIFQAFFFPATSVRRPSDAARSRLPPRAVNFLDDRLPNMAADRRIHVSKVEIKHPVAPLTGSVAAWIRGNP